VNWLSINDSMAAFFELTDEQAERVSKDTNFHLDGKFAQECINAKGDNCVITLLICRTEGTKDIFKGLKSLRSRYKTVSFWNRKHKRFYGGCYDTHPNS